jgi:PAS domain S-box-containing protein
LSRHAVDDQLDAERRVAELASELLALESDAIESGLQRALGTAGSIARADEANLIAIDPHGREVFQRIGWSAAGDDDTTGTAWRDGGKSFPWTRSLVTDGSDVVHVPRVADMPEEAREDRAALLAEGVRSYLVLPIVEGDLLRGILAFRCLEHEREWSATEIARLKLIAHVFSSALHRKRSDDERLRSEERLLALAAYGRDVICEFSLAGKLIYISPTIETVLGYPPDEILEMKPSDLLFEEDRVSIGKAFEPGDPNSGSRVTLVRARHQDGSLRWLEGEGSLFQSATGEKRVVAVVRDATRRQLEREDLEERLRLEQHVANVAQAFVRSEAQHVDEGISGALGAAAALAGADRCYLIASSPSPDGSAQIYDWCAEGVPRRVPLSDGKAMARFAAFSELIHLGQPIAVPSLSALGEDASEERAHFEANGIVSYLAFPLRSGEDLTGVLGFECVREEHSWSDGRLAVLRLVAELFSNAVRRKRQEDERDRSQQALEHQLDLERRVAELSRDLFDLGAAQLGDGIQSSLRGLADLSGAEHLMLLLFEDARSADDLVMHEWWAEIVPSGNRRSTSLEGDFRFAQQKLQAGEVYAVGSLDELPDAASDERDDLLARGVCSQLVIPLLSGKRLIGILGIECLTHELRWSEETVTLLGLAGDVMMSAVRRKRAADELRDSQTQLLQSQKMEAVGTLAGGIAHDFNNQLAVMLGNTRFILGQGEQPGEVREALVDVVRAAEHCAELTQALLAFSRRTPVETLPLDVKRLIGDVRDLLAPLLPASIRLDTRVERGVAWVEADRTQLQQVLINLIVNARDAMPDGGRLLLIARNCHLGAAEAAQLSMATSGACVEMRVQDDGLGMSAEVGNRVFEPFFTTKDVGRGTGLGLATAYGIVQQSGGSISFESAPGRGTTFRVVLPAARSGAAAGAGTARAAVGDGTETVLLVEDEPALRRLLRRMLEGRGYRVLQAANGEEGLRIGEARLRELDLIITDFVMPLMSGADLARALLERRPELPVLFLSGYADGDVEDVSGDLGRSRFLQKPFNDDAFYECVRNLLESK